jgi:hypothetical protein
VLRGSASDYTTGVHAVAGVTGTGLFLTTESAHELIAIIQSGGVVSNANTINTASFV